MVRLIATRGQQSHAVITQLAGESVSLGQCSLVGMESVGLT